MKKLVYMVLACLCSTVVLAETVTQERAQQVGMAFLSSMAQIGERSIQIQASSTNDHIAVYNISGQLLQTIYGADIDLSFLPNGFYVLQKHMTDGSVVSETIAKY